MYAILLFVVLAQSDELKPGVISQPRERAVRFVTPGDYFAKNYLVRLLPVEVDNAKIGSQTFDTIKANCFDAQDPFAHRRILASDFKGDGRKWFEREAARLCHNQKIEEQKTQSSPKR